MKITDTVRVRVMVKLGVHFVLPFLPVRIFLRSLLPEKHALRRSGEEGLLDVCTTPRKHCH